jgi:hypothetical protein
MGIETVLFATMALASVGTSVAGGLTAKDAAFKEADLQDEQAQIAREEAFIEADRAASEKRNFLKRQKLAFLKSGVSLAGSPLLVLETTRSESQKEVDAIVNRGLAQERLLRQRASITRKSGRNALLQGIGGGVSSGAQSFVSGKTAGIF